jgi:PAS domain S-box-containing protein
VGERFHSVSRIEDGDGPQRRAGTTTPTHPSTTRLEAATSLRRSYENGFSPGDVDRSIITLQPFYRTLMDDETSPDGRAIDIYTALETIQDIVVFTGPRPTKWEYVSPGFEAFYGISKETVQDDATRILERIHPDDRDQTAALFDGLTADPTEMQFDHRVLTPDGTNRWIRVHTWPIAPDPGDQPGIVGVMIDISEQKHREQELIVLHRLLQHDIRNDMAVITGWIDVLADQTRGTQDIINRIQTASEQVLNLIEDTQEIVHTTSDDFATESEPTHVRPMLETILEEKRELYPHAEFEIEYHGSDVAVAANALLSTVFRNLISNAIKHNDNPTPTVSISVATQGETARITFSDNGPGIPDEQESMLFKMGEKGSDSTGTGLGLYLCRQIVDSFDGSIRYEAPESGGATFCVEVPLTE